MFQTTITVTIKQPSGKKTSTLQQLEMPTLTYLCLDCMRLMLVSL
jgi:hypothetical protein